LTRKVRFHRHEKRASYSKQTAIATKMLTEWQTDWWELVLAFNSKLRLMGCASR